jgi:sodium/bile acid cotransporter 7
MTVPAILTAAELTDADKKRIVNQMFAEYSKEFPSVKTIDPKKAMDLAGSEDLVVVDVRHEKEMAVSVIPGAITKSEFLSQKESYHDKTIVVYCTIGYRSGIFAAEMQKQSFDVYNLKGGILSWVLEGGQVRNNTGIVKQVHVYGEKWRYVPDGYDAVVFGFFERMLK